MASQNVRVTAWTTAVLLLAQGFGLAAEPAPPSLDVFDTGTCSPSSLPGPRRSSKPGT